MDFLVDFRRIRHRAADLLSQQCGVPLSQAMDQCFNRARADLKPIRDVFIGGWSYAVNWAQENF
jgi:hypothetical protein